MHQCRLTDHTRLRYMRKNCVLVPKLKSIFCPCQEEPREQTCGFAGMFNNIPVDEDGDGVGGTGLGKKPMVGLRLGVWQKQAGGSDCADRNTHLDGADRQTDEKSKRPDRFRTTPCTERRCSRD